jgi:hypothetical protein
VRAQRFDAGERRQVVAAEVMRGLGQERLSAVTRCEESRDTIGRRAEVVAVTQLHRARVQRHAHAELGGLGPWLAMERPLGLERGCDGVGRGRERGAEGVAAGLEDVAAMILDAMAQQRIVARQRRAHRCRMRLPQARAALDVREQQCDRAAGKVCHRSMPVRGRAGADDTR